MAQNVLIYLKWIVKQCCSVGSVPHGLISMDFYANSCWMQAAMEGGDSWPKPIQQAGGSARTVGVQASRARALSQIIKGF